MYGPVLITFIDLFLFHLHSQMRTGCFTDEVQKLPESYNWANGLG